MLSLRPQEGKMQEWLNWPAWKASKPQKGFGGSNPPLSAKESERGDFYRLALLFAPRGGFGQLVAPRQTSLHVVSVVHRFAITMQRADTAK